MRARRRDRTRRGGGRFTNFLRGCVGGLCRRGTRVVPVNESAIGSPPPGPTSGKTLNIAALEQYVKGLTANTAARQAAAEKEFEHLSRQQREISNILSRPLPGSPSNANVEAELAALIKQGQAPASQAPRSVPRSATRRVAPAPFTDAQREKLAAAKAAVNQVMQIQKTMRNRRAAQNAWEAAAAAAAREAAKAKRNERQAIRGPGNPLTDYNTEQIKSAMINGRYRYSRANPRPRG